MRILNNFKYQDEVENTLDAALLVSSALVGFTLCAVSAALHSLAAVSLGTMEMKLDDYSNNREESDDMTEFKKVTPGEQLALAYEIVRDSQLTVRKLWESIRVTDDTEREGVFPNGKQGD